MLLFFIHSAAFFFFFNFEPFNALTLSRAVWDLAFGGLLGV